MTASVLIEYNVKSLDKTFDYIIPDRLKDKIKVGNKVLVPFGKVFIEGSYLESLELIYKFKTMYADSSILLEAI